jgi:hypothetical protein
MVERSCFRSYPDRALRGLAGAALAVFASAAPAQESRPLLYSCVSEGRPVTSDRPIAKCEGEQRIVNPDGSAYRLMPAPQTEEERAAADAKLQEESAADTARALQARRDRLLLTRYPNERKFNEARKDSSDSLHASIHEAESRIAQLAADRKKLQGEAALYAGKALPSKLKSAIDSSDASLASEKEVLQDREADLTRTDKLYDDDLARLKKLWPPSK